MCESDLYSTGFSGCQECTFWENFKTENSYKKNIIDSGCEIKAVVDNGGGVSGRPNSGNNGSSGNTNGTTLGDILTDADTEESESSTVGWVLIPVIVLALASIISTVVLVMKGLCCKCCYKNFKGLAQY